jgi:predicted acetyltransferase
MSYRTATADDREALVDRLVEAYHIDRPSIVEGLARRGVGHFRVVTSPDGIEGALELIPAGQWFGGQCLGTGAVAWVVTRVASRGSGVAKRLMQSALEELRAAGIPLSTLYASTAALYRKVGYEWAGHAVRYHLPLATIPADRREGQVERLTRVDAPEVQAIYAACAQRDAGLLERDASFWADRFDPLPSPELAAYVVRHEGQAEGYALIDEKSHDRQLMLRDMLFTTRRAGQRLLTLLADYGSLFDTAVYWSGPDDPLGHLLPEDRVVAAEQKRWMLRIVDVPGALAGRGYPPQLQAELHFDVTDSLLAENAGRWRLRIEAGRGRVERGGEGRLRLDVGSLAALYTGYARPESLVLAERLAGPAGDVALAGLAFSGPRPYMSDVF